MLLGPSLQREPYEQRLFGDSNFTALTRQAVREISSDRVTLCGLDSGIESEVEADLVILETGGVPRRDLYDDLVVLGVEAHLAGDALASRDLQHAFASGRRVGEAV